MHYLYTNKSSPTVGKMKSGLVTLGGPTPKPPKGGFNTFGHGLSKPPLGGLGVDILLFIVSKTNC